MATGPGVTDSVSKSVTKRLVCQNNKSSFCMWFDDLCVVLTLRLTRRSTSGISQVVGALSPVSYKGLHLGWTKTSFYLQVIHFTSHYTKSLSFFFFKYFFLAYLYSAGTQHGNLHPAGWPILFCKPTQEPMLATANKGKNQERFWKKCWWMDQKGRNKSGRNPWQ